MIESKNSILEFWDPLLSLTPPFPYYSEGLLEKVLRKWKNEITF